MQAADRVHIPLSTAMLCADCDSIGNDFANCPACGSTSLMLVSNVMRPLWTVKSEASPVRPVRASLGSAA
jgi:hypothetical protein